ncbi:aldo/keto reductase [Natronosalvus caseinilyticus]|uniref:aldo/keto reductase n=1 Tax=Natronosalvus caseinilyticus TaxID=2953747 RepID=UPI0028B07C4D|nr:aldo/keto reductase [Natronosalvus caseinilyticus]
MSRLTIDSTVSAADASIPALGFGTARITGEDCAQAVEWALEAGYRHLDTATMYDNESAVGDGLERAEVPRDEVFVVTKIDPEDAAFDDVIESARGSCDRLGIETIDLLLLHAPSDEVPLEITLDAMNHLQDEGVVDHIGVSNFSVPELEEAVDRSETPIVTNQVKYNPYTRQDALLEYCLEADVSLTAYSPLARGDVADDERLESIGERHGKSAAQVALRWLLQQPSVVAIPKAASREHVEANADCFDVELSEEEMREVFEISGESPAFALEDEGGGGDAGGS